jgi:hypothetical protein
MKYIFIGYLYNIIVVFLKFDQTLPYLIFFKEDLFIGMKKVGLCSLISRLMYNVG